VIGAGAAVDAAPAIDAAIADGNDADRALRAPLDTALVERATSEQDPELSASLFELIGKQKLVTGADACRAGLTAHRVPAKAAAECLRLLGMPVETMQPTPPVLPPVDVTTVINASAIGNTSSLVNRQLHWRLSTTRGDIVIALRPDVAPWNVATIVTLARRGFYDGTELHRVVPGFVVQGGDPTGSGTGGPGFVVPAEPTAGDHFMRGAVGIADAGPDSGSSQFFIMHARAPHLDGRYTYIGDVIAGQTAADSLLVGDWIVHTTIE
jgi:cyclophilin family peptidyl-prolyl cis-trans isomerase